MPWRRGAVAMALGDVSGLLRRRGYTELRKVGEGSFGKALLVQSSDGGKLICKMVDISKATTKEANEAAKEASLLARLRHPYIVRYRESFTDYGWLCILMDFCEGGDLSKVIAEARRGRKPLAETQVLMWTTQAILALKYLHDQHILHRDLKPANFFLAKGSILKMGDFGIAKALACTIAVAKTQIGTPYYLSPELCQEKPYAWPADIWAMGCIVYEMCALKVPFDAPNIPGLVQKIVRGPIPPIQGAYSSFIKTLCVEMLERNTSKRPSTDDILKRPPVQAIVKQMLNDVQLGGDSAGGGAEPFAPVQAPAEVPMSDACSYAQHAGRYRKGDTVEYNSSAHKSWLPAKIINVDGNGRIIIDLKPNTWITVDDQATRVRPKAAAAAVGARAPSPMYGRSPSVGSARGEATPGIRRTPSYASARGDGTHGGGLQRSPSVASARGDHDRAEPADLHGAPAHPLPGLARSPSTASAHGEATPGSATPGGMHRQPSPLVRGGGGNAYPSLVARDSPMRQNSPAHRARTPGGGSSPGWNSYKVGDLVEYHSPSHKDWLHASILKADYDGRVIIDLKPNTWISKEEQAAKLRPRRATPAKRPSSRCNSPMAADRYGPPYSSPGGGLPRGSTPSRAASPRRGNSSGGGPPSRAASPRPYVPGGGGGLLRAEGTPRIRPPGLPQHGGFRAASPLRAGGRLVSGAGGAY